MFLRILFYILGIIFTTIGITNTILYLNLLSAGYTFTYYISYITKNVGCMLLPIGLLIIIFTIFIGGKNEIHIRHRFKF